MLTASTQSPTNTRARLPPHRRGEYDEGMHTFSTPIRLGANPGLDLDCQSIKATVLYNLGQLHVWLGEDDAAADFFYRALALTEQGCLEGR